MKNLGFYISELLAEHDCVIVPGFGGFVARPSPAYFSKAGNTLMPPGKSLVFNKNLNNSDGLLANHLCIKLSVSFREANNLLERWAGEAFKTLETQKRLELDKTGVLYLSKENNILFEPAVTGNHALHTFGLPVVNALAIDLNEKKEEPKVKDLTYRIAQEKTGNRTLMRISVAVSSLLIFTFLLFITAKQFPFQGSFASLNPFSTKEPAYILKPYGIGRIFSESTPVSAKAETAGLKALENSSKIFVVSSDTVNADKTKVIKAIKRNINNHGDFSGPFQVVVGCFAVEGNAHKLIDQLKNEGLEAGISGRNPRGLYVVSVAGFSTESLAREKLRQVKTRVPNAWIMIR